MEVNLVIKSIPKNLARRLTFRSPDFFKNEANFYNIVLKAFYDVQAVRKGVLRPFIEIPKWVRVSFFIFKLNIKV